MHDNKVSLWLEDAIAVAAFTAFLAAVPIVLSLEREPKQQQAKAPVRDCPVTISQYGPGERWYSPLPSAPACAGAVVPAPSYILSMPIQERRK